MTSLDSVTALVEVCTFHDGCKQGINQQIFNRKSISRKIMMSVTSVNGSV